MSINLRELLCGAPVRLRYTIRFSTCRVAHKESVAEHSYFVALYSLVIADWCESHYIKIARSTLLASALVHDLEESITGDIPRAFKYRFKHVKQSLDEAAMVAMRDLFSKIWDPDVSDLGIRRCVSLWQHAKDDTLEGRIVQFADFLSVLSYLLQERIDHNFLILEHCDSMKEYFKGFQGDAFSFIRPLVDQAEVLMEELFSHADLQTKA